MDSALLLVPLGIAGVIGLSIILYATVWLALEIVEFLER